MNVCTTTGRKYAAPIVLVCCAGKETAAVLCGGEWCVRPRAKSTSSLLPWSVVQERKRLLSFVVVGGV